MFQKQAIMRKVVYSLIPISLWSLYLYGWRVLAVTGVVFGVGVLSEFVMEKARNKKVSEAVLVTSALLALSLPPGVPLWVAAVASAFAVVMGKGVYGGFGRNIFNPAITGRIFTYISFPLLLQTTWMIPGGFGTLGMNGQATSSSIIEAVFVLLIIGVAFLLITKNYEKKGFVLWTILGSVAVTILLYVITAYSGLLGPEIDVVATVTPLEIYRGATGETLPAAYSYLRENSLLNLFLGRRSGSIGESSILLISLAGIYLIYTKTANWRMIVMTLVSAALLTGILFFTGAMTRLSPMMSPEGKTLLESLEMITKFLFSGSLFFVAVFMSTDPVSAPNKPSSQLVYGLLIGGVTIVIRVFSGFPEGTSFGILIANTFASLIDEVMPSPKKKAKAAAPAQASAKA
ncbi:MAG: RnfABCDGE type electron transport complex subunit D [Spirochaetales bacterium]|nr:RnfABCDGE type electron transport complex subunit D [Spirochaetales bacterium]